MRGKGSIMAVITGLALAALPARATETAPASTDVDARLQAVEQTVQWQNEIIVQQQRQIDELKTSKAGLSAVDELEAKVKKAGAGEMPSWLSGLKFSGDLRLRYEGIHKDNQRDVNHGRFRLRFGFEKKMTEELVAGFRLASGSSDDPTSTNQTFSGDFSKKTIWIDLAYLVYQPTAVKGLTIGAGKVKNPFVTTAMVWDSDVNPEGAFQTYTWDATETFRPFVTLGEMLVDEGDHDANMLAIQGGWNWEVAPEVVWTLAATYYDWMNVEEAGNYYRARGNTVTDDDLAAGDFDIVNVTNLVAFKASGLPITLFADYARNIGEDAPAPFDGEDTAYSGGLKLGSAKDKGDWQVDYRYAYIEPNSVVGFLADSDFGFADSKGHVVGFTYLLHRNVATSLTGYFTEPVSGGDESTTVHADVVLKF